MKSQVAVSFRVPHPDRPALELAIRRTLEALSGSWTVSVEADDASEELGWSIRLFEPGRLAAARVRPEQQTPSQVAAIISALASGPGGSWRTLSQG
jgi:hypothetical protein